MAASAADGVAADAEWAERIDLALLAAHGTRRGSKWIFRYGEAETPPLPSRLWLFGMYVAM